MYFGQKLHFFVEFFWLFCYKFGRNSKRSRNILYTIYVGKFTVFLGRFIILRNYFPCLGGTAGGINFANVFPRAIFLSAVDIFYLRAKHVRSGARARSLSPSEGTGLGFRTRVKDSFAAADAVNLISSHCLPSADYVQ